MVSLSQIRALFWFDRHYDPNHTDHLRPVLTGIGSALVSRWLTEWPRASKTGFGAPSPKAPLALATLCFVAATPLIFTDADVYRRPATAMAYALTAVMVGLTTFSLLTPIVE